MPSATSPSSFLDLSVILPRSPTRAFCDFQPATNMPDHARARAHYNAAHNPGRAPEIPQGAAFTQLMSLDRVTLEASDPEPAQTPTPTTATISRATSSSRPNPDGPSTETETPPTPTPTSSSPVTPSAGRVEYFRARYAPYRNAIAPTAFGGHVYAQAAWAAAQTVPRGFVLHNISGHFILPGVGRTPYTYAVRHVRDGSTYIFRAVDARQRGADICFTCLLSFKQHERSYAYEGHQRVYDVPTRYASVLSGQGRPRPEDHPLGPLVDYHLWKEDLQYAEDGDLDVPGVEARKVDMEAFDEVVDTAAHPYRHRQLQFYRLLGLPVDAEGDVDVDVDVRDLRRRDEAGDFDNLYICAHLFQSDRSSLFVIPWALRKAHLIAKMASLNHTVVIHTHGPALRMLDWDALDKRAREVQGEGGAAQNTPPPRWFTLEARSSRSGENRGLFEARVWAPDGTLVATAMQDGLIRLFSEEEKGNVKAVL